MQHFIYGPHRRRSSELRRHGRPCRWRRGADPGVGVQRAAWRLAGGGRARRRHPGRWLAARAARLRADVPRLRRVLPRRDVAAVRRHRHRPDHLHGRRCHLLGRCRGSSGQRQLAGGSDRWPLAAAPDPVVHQAGPGASLSFTVTAAFIETTDLNACLGPAVARPSTPSGLFCDLVKGELFLDVQAFTVPAAPDIIPFDTFFHVAGGATVSGYAENWSSEAWTTRYSQLPLWYGRGLRLRDRQPRRRPGRPRTDDPAPAPHHHHRPVVGRRRPGVHAAVVRDGDGLQPHRRDRPGNSGSSATAFLRDPLGIDSTSITFSGLEPTDVIGLDPPAETVVSPRRCPPDATGMPARCSSAPSGYTIGESNPTPAVGSPGPAAAPARSPPRSRPATAPPWPGPTTRRSMPRSASPTAMTPPCRRGPDHARPARR